MVKYSAIIKVILKDYDKELLIQTDFEADTAITTEEELCDICDMFVFQELKKRKIPLEKFDDYSVLCAKRKEV